MLKRAKVIVTEDVTVYAIHCINESCCTSHELRDKDKGCERVCCETHCLPKVCMSLPPKPAKHMGYEKTYEDKRSWDGHEKVVLVERGRMTDEYQQWYGLPC